MPMASTFNLASSKSLGEFRRQRGMRYLAFTQTGALVIPVQATVEILAIAAGGAGSVGGGGAGSVVYYSGTISSGLYPVNVGVGGTFTSYTSPGGNGGDSSVSGIPSGPLVAKGGGGGGAFASTIGSQYIFPQQLNGQDGGCGGGGGYGWDYEYNISHVLAFSRLWVGVAGNTITTSYPQFGSGKNGGDGSAYNQPICLPSLGLGGAGGGGGGSSVIGGNGSTSYCTWMGGIGGIGTDIYTSWLELAGFGQKLTDTNPSNPKRIVIASGGSGRSNGTSSANCSAVSWDISRPSPLIQNQPNTGNGGNYGCSGSSGLVLVRYNLG